ncbi:hypothetical protein QCD70_19185, partial [Agreia sp. PsM10]|nr:hypothetical protein [Agreia sp. PsM10]
RAEAWYPGGEAGLGGRARARAAAAPADSVVIDAATHELVVRFRRRESGLYGEAPYVEEWKTLPPRLHDDRSLEVTV